MPNPQETHLPIRVGIALGSNLGDGPAELDAAVEFLRSLSVGGEVRTSPRFRTAPVGCPPGSPDFLNAVAEIEVNAKDVPPRHLLAELQAFERSRARPADHGTNLPRTLDLDLIYYGDLRIDEPGLTLPHPRAHRRRFVLEPLACLRPELVLPGQNRSVRELLQNLAVEKAGCPGQPLS